MNESAVTVDRRRACSVFGARWLMSASKDCVTVASNVGD
jgi:hypothetical protein